ncbi:MAG: PilZ domain-containing protein [Moraxellaceae bacterium]|nr:PilZ domain-containing protein [Moraxellaceae bacterium]
MAAVVKSSRTYIRHPSDMPIEIHAEVDSEIRAPADEVGQRLKDISLGGLACRSDQPLSEGDVVCITIPVTQPPFEACGRVVWCISSGRCYDVGIQFMAHDDAFAARMVEQICHIEHYRNEVLRNEGRVLDSETAAMEWIGKYARDFPNPHLMH